MRNNLILWLSLFIVGFLSWVSFRNIPERTG